ncbi:IPT/TIG domain-containing protein [Streptomyces sp. NPDC021749]|uniref:IPT/TIG domain-containing protein n=1 Tax=Streptomyces sp. NPDC021749 TaxID=3154905 RepID=UPI0033C87EEF
MAPVVTSVSPSQGPPAGGTSVTLTGSGFTGATLVRFGPTGTNFVIVSDSQITAKTPAGTGTVQVTVTAPTGTSTQNVLFTYAAVPSLSSLSPASGPASGGNTVTLNGTNLSGAMAVFFGSSPATILTNTATQITVVAPAGPPSSVGVTVITAGGISNALSYTYVAAATPVLSSLSPTSGPTSGGNTVTLNGTNLTGATAVFFGPNPATILTNTGTQITVSAPAGPPSSVTVTVTTPSGTSNPLTYTYVAAATPVLSSLSPTSGPTSGGNTVTLNGTNLTGATSVKFGTNPATILTNTGTQITVSAPAGPPSSVNVTVTTAGGTSNPLPYFYIAAPIVNDLSTHLGPATGGNTVTVFGSNLTLTSAVNFGGNPATGITVVSDNQLTVTAPAGSGTVAVTVTTPGGTSTTATGNPYYTYLAAPVLTSLTPSHGSDLGGDAIVLGGSNLTYTDAVTFGGVPATFAAISDTQVVATSPGGAPGTVNVVAHTPAGNSNAQPYVYDPS